VPARDAWRPIQTDLSEADPTAGADGPSHVRALLLSRRMTDRWARWLLHDRHGGDVAARERLLAQLAPIRDRVLDGAELGGDETVLDLGCGDGLIGFGA